jgi:hypothetical protein
LKTSDKSVLILSRRRFQKLAIGERRNPFASPVTKGIVEPATEPPDDVWEESKEHYHWSNEKFGEVVSATNRNVVFRNNTPDFFTYTRNLLVNVRTTFS